MGRASKGKSKPKQSYAKGVATVVETAKNAQKHVADFRSEWADKFNALQQKFDRIVPAIAQQFAQLSANNQIVTNCVDSIDLQQQAMMKIDANIYAKLGRLEAIINETVFLDDELTVDSFEVDDDGIKVHAMDTYVAIAEQSVQLAREERAAAIKAQEEAQRQAQEAAIKAQQAREEESKANEILQQAQDDDKLVGEPGGPGVPLPAGAEVFGG